jgi:hypothetical protein
MSVYLRGDKSMGKVLLANMLIPFSTMVCLRQYKPKSGRLKPKKARLSYFLGGLCLIG